MDKFEKNGETISVEESGMSPTQLSLVDLFPAGRIVPETMRFIIVLLVTQDWRRSDFPTLVFRKNFCRKKFHF